MGETKQVESIDKDERNVHKWRKDWFLDGGFSPRNADLLAASTIDYRYANQVLRNAKQKGYDEDFVMKLIT